MRARFGLEAILPFRVYKLYKLYGVSAHAVKSNIEEMRETPSKE